MKRSLSILLAAAVLLSLLAGCGGVTVEAIPGRAERPDRSDRSDLSDQADAAPAAEAGAGEEKRPEGNVLSPEVTSARTDEGILVDVGPYVLDGEEELRVVRQPDEENAEEGYKIEAFEISLGDLHELGDYITIRIPYDAAWWKNGQDPARCVGAKYKNEETGLWEDVLFEVDAEEQEVVIYTDHLSYYGVLYVEDEGRRNALVTDVLNSPLYMDRATTMGFAARIAADDAGVRKDMSDYVAKASDLFFDYADRLDNAINIVALGDSKALPTWLDTSIPDTNQTLFSALGYIATATNLLKLTAQETLGGGADKGAALNLIRDVGSKVTLYWADAFTAVGSGALSVGMGGVLIIDKMLTAFAEEAQSTKMEDISYVYHHYNEGFSAPFAHKLMKPKDWREKVIQVIEKNPDAPEIAVAALEAGFRKYASEFFDLTGDQMYEVAADTPGVTVRRIPNFTEAEKQQLIDEYVAHLKDKTMPAVLKSVQNYMVRKSEEVQLQAINAIKDYYNSKITITMREQLPEGGKSRYAGYTFRFAPLNETASPKNWSGTWPESGSVKDTTTLIGIMTAGFPHTVEFFEPGADMDRDKPALTVPFVISVPGIEITFAGEEPLPVEAFMGTWVDSEGARMILAASGDNVIVKEPDLSWYGGDVVCTEYRAEYDGSARTLNLYGLTSWVVGPELLDAAVYETRPLELDASSIRMELTAAETKDGVILTLSDGSGVYTRP